jgi:hypothetical protein
MNLRSRKGDCGHVYASNRAGMESVQAGLKSVGGVAPARYAARLYRGVARVKGGAVCLLMEVRLFANRASTASRQKLNSTFAGAIRCRVGAVSI